MRAVPGDVNLKQQPPFQINSFHSYTYTLITFFLFVFSILVVNLHFNSNDHSPNCASVYKPQQSLVGIGPRFLMLPSNLQYSSCAAWIPPHSPSHLSLVSVSVPVPALTLCPLKQPTPQQVLAEVSARVRHPLLGALKALPSLSNLVVFVFPPCVHSPGPHFSPFTATVTP